MPAAFLDVFVGEDADEDAEGDDGAVGDLHEGCDEGGEAESFDDDGAEVGDACGRMELVSLILFVVKGVATGMDVDVDVPPFGMLQTVPRRKNKYSLTSQKASFT